jgi:pimeloyl-ACP methyl ester carboxylesterase
VDRVTVNGVELALLEEGTGPLVLLLHGFPDSAHTWDATRPVLAAAGFRAVSPFLRGYHPSGLAPDGRYDVETLGRDVLGLIGALGERQAIVVGHDWGAGAAFAATGLDPARVRKLITVAIPHVSALKPSLGLAWHARHFARFKLPGAAWAVRRRGFALVDELVRRWSPAWQVPEGATDQAKRSLGPPGCAEAAVAYYKQVPLRVPGFMRAPVTVPSVAFAGEDDFALDPSVYERARPSYQAGYEIVRMPGGHFMHLEHPARFTAELLRVVR